MCALYSPLIDHFGAKGAGELPVDALGFDLTDFSNDLPPMLGGEYWSESVAVRGLSKLYAALRSLLCSGPCLTLVECVRTLNPDWTHWGKIIFHLTENKVAGTQKLPFAFMATYHDTTPEGRGKHRPLAAALKLRKENREACGWTLPAIKRKGLVLAYLSRFKQICNHPAQFSGTGVYDAKSSGKFARLAELAEMVASRQEKMLVFTQYREMCAPLHDFLAGCFGRKGLVLHGGTPVKRRAELVDNFQQENGPPFFVISLKAGGTGLNLTAASQVVHFDRWWNPAVENQASDRAYRIGQNRNMLIHKFICTGTLEEKIDAIIDNKQKMSSSLLAEGAEKLLTEMSNEELMDFVSFTQNSLPAE